MNFLAHLYLSFGDPDLTIGNFIADHVKGQKKDLFPAGIRRGIELHRAIDYFTDTHPVTARSRQVLYHRHSKYAGVVVDLFYDHFLAKNFTAFSAVPLPDFARDHYRLFQDSTEHLPQSVLAFLPYMVERDWLTQYATVEGIGRTLTGLSKRVRFPNRMDEAEVDLRLHYSELEMDFQDFFPSLIEFARHAAIPEYKA